MTAASYIWVALGSALGGTLRFWLSGAIAQKFGETFPWGTIVVNVTGCFLVGFAHTFLEDASRGWISPGARQFLIIGVLGGYTTFSAFSLQTLNLARDGAWLYAGGNVMVSVAFCLAAVWLGHLCAQAWHG